jgi:hypothetical protein
VDDSYGNGRRDNPVNIFRAGVDVKKILYADNQILFIESHEELQRKYLN